MGRGFNGRILLGASPAATALATAPIGYAGEPITPRNGTYSGVGSMDGDESHYAQVGFTLKGGKIVLTAGVFDIPFCNGGFSVPPTTLGPNRFETTSTGSNMEENRVTGRWVSNTRVKGRVVLERPSAASCGDPGTYVFRYKGKRYGKP